MAKELILKLKEGDLAPAFTVDTNGGGRLSLADFAGKNVILYFYPKDDTPGCTKEACAFRDGYTEFKKRGAVMLGVSPDPVKSHDKFVKKFQLPFTLLADNDKKIVEAYGVWGEKGFHGPQIHGHAPGDLPYRPRRQNQKDLAPGKAGGARSGSAGRAQFVKQITVICSRSSKTHLILPTPRPSGDEGLPKKENHAFKRGSFFY